MSDGLSPDGSLTMPTTVKLVAVPLELPTAIGEPTLSFSEVA